MFAGLIEKLVEASADYLVRQLQAGVDAVQIFDSLGGVLSDGSFGAASAVWIQRIVASLQGRVPVIVFAKGTHGNWADLAGTGAQVLGVDWNIKLADVAARLPGTIGVQGNLDPFLLASTPEAVRTETQRILHEMRGRAGHVFNLGHGVPPNARLQNIASLVETVRAYEHLES